MEEIASALTASRTGLVADYSASLIRLIFRIILTLLSISLGYVGNLCLRAKVRYSLLRDERGVPLHHLIDWMSNLSIFLRWKDLKKVPGGVLAGLWMILIVLLLYADDLLIVTLIQTDSVHSRCYFDRGLVIDPNFSPTTVVPSNGAPADLAQQAQKTSLINNGQIGVYRKVNSDLRFMADHQDVLGSWVCALQDGELSFPQSTMVEDVLRELLHAGYLYEFSTPAVKYTGFDPQGTSWSHLVIMTASTGSLTGKPFRARVAVDLNGQTTGHHVMASYECTADSSLHRILSYISAGETFPQWCENLQGASYNGWYTDAKPDLKSVIQQTLNSMTMVGAGDNYQINATARGETQGCRVTMTSISWAVLALFLLTIVLLLGMVLYLSIMTLRIRQLMEQKQISGIQQEQFLQQADRLDTVGWIMRAVEENQRAANSVGEFKTERRWKTDDLHRWVYKRQGDTQLLGLSGPDEVE